MVNIFVLALLMVGDTVLLVRRHNTSFGDGLYSLVGGKVEQGETAKDAIVREVCEETTLDIPKDKFTLVHVLNRNGTETEFIALCFKADISSLPKPRNNEPDKHDDMRFFRCNALPANMLPAHKQIIQCVREGVNYSEHGW